MKSKKEWLVSVALTAAFGGLSPAWADEQTVDGVTWTYSVDGGAATVTGAEPATGAVKIPSTLGGKSVTAIGEYAIASRSGMTSVVIPNSVKAIGSGAFSDCENLKKATIGSGVEFIGDGAFSYCQKLRTVQIPAKTREIGNNAFYDCQNLTNATIGAAVEFIGDGAFSCCFKLTGMTIPASVKYIGGEVFFCCQGLKAITVAGGNAKYSSSGGVLYNKSQDTLLCFPAKKAGAFTVPDGVKRIATYAFYNCDGVTSVTLPEGVTDIGKSAFAYCDKLAAMKIPASVKSIGEQAFGCCSKLAKITVDSGNANYAAKSGVLFNKAQDTLLCFPADKVAAAYTIPSGVTDIAIGAFAGCTGLTSLVIPSCVRRIGANAFSECTGMTSATLAEGVVEIGSGAFQYCDALTAMVIPDSVGDVGENAFLGCYGLETMSVPYAFKTAVSGWELPDACAVTVRKRIALSIATEATLPVALADSYYWQPLLARGGTPPYTWTIPNPGEWPGWLENDHIEEWEDMGYAHPFFAGRAMSADIGNHAFTLRVTDSAGKTAERTFTLQVVANPDQSPEIQWWSPQASDVFMEPGETVTFEIAASDPEGEALTYEWTVSDSNWSTVPGFAGERESSLAFSRSADEQGTYHIDVYASDGRWTGSRGWTVTVAEKKPLAMAGGALPTVTEGVYTNVGLGVTGGVGPYHTEWDGDFPDGFNWPFSCTYADGIELHGAADEGTAGTYEFTATVTDADGETVSGRFSLVVEDNPNQCPTIKSHSPTNRYVRIQPGKTVTFKVAVSDPEGAALDWEWSVHDYDWKAVTNAATAGSFKFKSPAGQEGIYYVSAVIADGPWTLEENWRVIAENKKALAMAGGTLPAAMEGEFSDIELGVTGGVGPYTLSIEGDLPGGIEYDPECEVAGWIGVYGRPDEGTAGTHKFTAKVTDSAGATASKAYTLVVKDNPNKAPVLSGCSPSADEVGIQAGTKVDFSVKASDPEGKPLSLNWYVDDSEGNCLFWLEGEESFSWTFNREGRFTVACDVSDGEWYVTREWTVMVGPQTVWRFYSKSYKGHFFTISEEEKDNLIKTNPNWNFEGGAYRAYTWKASGTVALYRFYSKSYKGHFFTINKEEKDNLIATNPNWKYEGVAYYVHSKKAKGSVPVYRFWSAAYKHHFYTIDETEKDTLIATNPNWKYEGIAFYALPLPETKAGGKASARSVAAPEGDGGQGGATFQGWGRGTHGDAGTVWSGVAVTTSDGTDGSAVADGDEGTGWSPEGTDGAWVVLSFEDPMDVAAVVVTGENLPEELRVLLSEDAEEWFEGEGGTSRYVWVAWPGGEDAVVVREVEVVRE